MGDRLNSTPPDFKPDPRHKGLMFLARYYGSEEVGYVELRYIYTPAAEVRKRKPSYSQGDLICYFSYVADRLFFRKRGGSICYL